MQWIQSNGLFPLFFKILLQNLQDVIILMDRHKTILNLSFITFFCVCWKNHNFNFQYSNDAFQIRNSKFQTLTFNHQPLNTIKYPNTY